MIGESSLQSVQLGRHVLRRQPCHPDFEKLNFRRQLREWPVVRPFRQFPQGDTQRWSVGGARHALGDLGEHIGGGHTQRALRRLLDVQDAAPSCASYLNLGHRPHADEQLRRRRERGRQDAESVKGRKAWRTAVAQTGQSCKNTRIDGACSPPRPRGSLCLIRVRPPQMIRGEVFEFRCLAGPGRFHCGFRRFSCRPPLPDCRMFHRFDRPPDA